GAARDEGANEIDIDDLAEQLRRGLFDRQVASDAGGCDQAAQRPERVDHPVEGLRHLVLVGHAAFDQDRVLAIETLLRIRERIRIDVDDGDRPAVVQKPPGGRETDARGASGDHGRWPQWLLSRIHTWFAPASPPMAK